MFSAVHQKVHHKSIAKKDTHRMLMKLTPLMFEKSSFSLNFLQSDIAMSLDFESDISPKIRFLVDLGIRPEDLGYIFTYNPNIFKLDPGKEF
jgi:hypothetical protein